MRKRLRKDVAAIQDTVNEVDPLFLDLPSTRRYAVNEFKNNDLASVTFSPLFPNGKGDATNRRDNMCSVNN